VTSGEVRSLQHGFSTGAAFPAIKRPAFHPRPPIPSNSTVAAVMRHADIPAEPPGPAAFSM
jgi:hypothetical protein